MKIHRILAEAAAAVVDSVFSGGKVLDHQLAAAFARNPRWGKRDRGFVATSVFEVVRWRRALAFVADSGEVPALMAAQWRRMGLEVPEWWGFDGVSLSEMERRESALAGQVRAVRESIPEWLDELGEAELGGDRWSLELAALNRRARVFLRANTLRNTRDEARAWLAVHGVETAPVVGLPDALVVAEGKSLPKNLLSEGRVEIQDAGSQVIAPLLDARPGERLVDACCGAGGKTLHLAALTGNQALIEAFDVDDGKLAELNRRAARAGVRGVRTSRVDELLLQRLEGQADRLLIDAPCSGLGTLKRQPDLKWRLTPARLDEVRAVQKKLLRQYARILKPGGRLVYATCSILPSENHQASAVLLDDPHFERVSEHPVSPADSGFDGFYAAVFTRKQG